MISTTIVAVALVLEGAASKWPMQAALKSRGNSNFKSCYQIAILGCILCGFVWLLVGVTCWLSSAATACSTIALFGASCANIESFLFFTLHLADILSRCWLYYR
jgi:hypothetical protein